MNNIPKSTINIARNFFNNSNYILESNSNFYNTAITLQHTSPDIKSPLVHIWDNQITDHRIGIHAMNIFNLGIGIDPSGVISGNNIYYNSPVIDDFFFGLWIQRCESAMVVDNEVFNDVPVSGNINFRGIDLESSTYCNINCNNISNLPCSMNFTGYCDGTLLRKNIMTEYDIAINSMGATLPFQGKEITPTVWEALDNEWYDVSNDFRIGGTLAQGIDWFYQNTANQFEPFPNQGNVIAVQANSAIPLCNDITIQSRETRFGPIVGDSLQFEEYQLENIYRAKSIAYEEMSNDSTILFSGNSFDASFQDFYDMISQSNIGAFNMVNSMATDSSLLILAISLNESINDTNWIEYNKKLVNDIYLNGPAIEFPLTVLDTMVLMDISSLSWTTGGEAIYMAASMLGKEIHSSYVPLRMKNLEALQSIELNSNITVTIYPNPTSNLLYIAGLPEGQNELFIYDCFGNLVYQEMITSRFEFINTKKYSSGIYILKLLNNSSLKCDIRFIVLK